MTARYIIAKYASMYAKSDGSFTGTGVTWSEADAAGGYTAKQVGHVGNFVFADNKLKDAESILKKANDLNPGVYYGIVDLKEQKLVE